MSDFPRELALNSWPMYGVGMFIILLRTVARCRRVRSITALAPDDWIMMTAVPAFYTTLVVCLNVIATGGGSNLYLPEEFATFSESDIQERIKGSKIVVVSEQAMLNLIWSLKGCMLFMYARMTIGTNHTRWIKIVAVWVVVGWVAVQIAFFTACRPFKGYWGMPPPDPQCTTLQHYSITQAVFNLSSDCLIIAIPMPMIFSLTLPLKQKLVLGIVFSMGTFVILAAILTKVYNLSDVYDTAYMLWYVREASVAVYVANLPGIWPLLREHISFLRSHASNGNSNSGLPRYGSHSQYGNVSKMTRSRVRTTQVKEEDEVELGRHSFSRSAAQSTSSEEKQGRRLSLDSDERALNDGGWKLPNLEVHVNKTVEVQRDSWDGGNAKGDRTYRSTVKIEGPEAAASKK